MKRLIGLSLILTLALFASCGEKGRKIGGGGMAPPPKVLKIEKTGEGPIEVAVGGDLMLDDLALPWILKYGYDYPLAGMAEKLKTFDAVLANLEVPVTSNCVNSGRHYSYSMPPKGLDALKRANIRIVTLSNNHVLDCGSDSLAEEMKRLDEAGIAWLGAGRNKEESEKGLVLDIGVVKIGFIGLYGKDVSAYPNRQALTDSNIERGINRMRRDADIVVVVPHWGDNYKPIKKSQITVGRRAIDLGADAVIGHHPHVWQPVEVYNGKPIVYSVGNFAFGTGNQMAKNSLLAVMEIRGKKLQGIRLLPLFNQNRNPEVAWQPKIMSGPDARKFLEKLIEGSKNRNADLKIRNDEGILKL